MSKRNRSREVFARFALGALACALLTSGVGGAVAQRARPAIVNPRTAAVREATAEVLRETSEIRKLPVRRKVRSGAQSRADIEKMLVRNLKESSKPKELEAAELMMKKLGMVPADFRLRTFLIDLLTEQVAGYYDPKSKHFYLADWIDLDGQKPVIAHELTHALQDQHFNLRRFEKWPRHDSDAQLAARALIEGDATVLMMQYIMRSPMRQLAMLRAMVTGGAGSTEQIDKAPRVLRETLLFPYTNGMTWATQLHKRGGWELISQAFKDLPKSTEQILHPEKYFAREEPVSNIAAKDLSSSLGKGWKMLDHDVNGEWGYYLILDEYLQSREESQRAAAGWNGDRYALFAGPGVGNLLITQKTFWDTEADAQEFYEAYSRRTSKRYGAEPSGTESAVRRFWKTNQGGVLVKRAGSTVVIIEGVPEGIQAETLIKLLGARP